MITEVERREIEEEIKKAPTKKAAVIDVLKVVQKHRRWIPDEALEEAADMLGMTPAEVDSIATFFSLIYRRPVGKHVILVCDSVSCWLVGYEDVKQHLWKGSASRLEKQRKTEGSRFCRRHAWACAKRHRL